MTLEEARQALEDAGLYARIREAPPNKTPYIRVGTSSAVVGGIPVVRNAFTVGPEGPEWFVHFIKGIQGFEERFDTLEEAVAYAIEHARSLPA